MIKLIKRIFKIKRYFLVCFHFTEKTGIEGFGSRVFHTDGQYINIRNCISMMKNQHTDFKRIGIVNIIELTGAEWSDLRK